MFWKRTIITYFLAAVGIGYVLVIQPMQAYALTFQDIVQQTDPVETLDRLACDSNPRSSCPVELNDIYEDLRAGTEFPRCATSAQEFYDNPRELHYWIEDEEITSQGKANERARQFLDWALTKDALHSHPTIRTIWGVTSSFTFFLVIIVVVIFGIGIIVAQRTNFQLNLKLFPTLIRIGLMLLFIALSGLIVWILIEGAELLMAFFIDSLGGRQLFNIYFTQSGATLGGSEKNYTEFIGCRDLNIRVQEAVNAQLFLFDLTNITYYIMGIMIILRNILLWFLMFVAPFLAILMPFVFIRNIGWIWIGVFFQWLFYGPLLALFLGGMNVFWQYDTGLPFNFDFSRTNAVGVSDIRNSGYIYPTAMNISYGGPNQRLLADGTGNPISASNNGNYVETFTEYVISLLMLWGVIFFPWWLLRIFRDYCCEGIYGMRNILLAMYDQSRAGPSPKGPDGPSPKIPDVPNFLRNISPQKEQPVDRQREKFTVRIDNIEQLKQAATQDLVSAINVKATNLRDIAKYEMDDQLKNATQKTVSYLSNPANAQSGKDRQQFMNLRTELFNRAVKQDSIARQMLSSTSTSQYERDRLRSEITQSAAQTATRSLMDSLATSENLKQSFAKSMSSQVMMSQLAGISKSAANQMSQAIRSALQQSIKSNISAIAKQSNLNSQQQSRLQSLASENRLVRMIEKGQTQQLSKLLGITQQQASTISDSLERNSIASVISNNNMSTIADRFNMSEQQARDMVSQIENTAYNGATISQAVESVAKQMNLNTQQLTQLKELAQKTSFSTNSRTRASEQLSSQVGITRDQANTMIKLLEKSSSTSQNIQSSLEQISREMGFSQSQKNQLSSLSSDSLANIAEITRDTTQMSKELNISQEQASDIISALQKSVEAGASIEDAVKAVAKEYSLSTEQQAKLLELTSQSSLAKILKEGNTDMLTKLLNITQTQASKMIDSLKKISISQSQSLTDVISRLVGTSEESSRQMLQGIRQIIRENIESSSQFTAEQYGLNKDQSSRLQSLASENRLAQMIEKGQTDSIARSVGISREDAQKIAESLEKSSIKSIQNSLPTLAKNLNVSVDQLENALKTKNILDTFARSSASSINQIMKSMSKDLNISLDAIKSTIKTTVKTQQQQANRLLKSYMNKLIGSSKTSNVLAKRTNTSVEKMRGILKSYLNHMEKPAKDIVNVTAKTSNSSNEEVKDTLQQAGNMFFTKDMIFDFAEEHNVNADALQEAIRSTAASMARSGTTGQSPDSPEVGGPGGPSPEPTTEEAVVDVSTATGEKEAEIGGEDTDVGGPGGSGGPGPLETAEEVSVSPASPDKEAEIGGEDTDINLSGGPSPQPTAEEAQIDVTPSTPEKQAGSEDTDIDTSEGPTPQPTSEQQQLAESFVQSLLANQDYLAQLGVDSGPDVPEEERTVVVRNVIRIVQENVDAADEIVNAVAEEEDIDQEAAGELIKENLEIAADPENNIEKIVAVPQTVSIEEYEDLKEMWSDQYENGEIPPSSDTQDREEWIEQDIIAMTNIMNKLLSEDETLQQQGIDELGFIIPVFMMNNLQGDQLITYLKAKLSAAKSVRKLLARERKAKLKAKEEIREEEETLLNVKTKKKKEKKYMQMDFDDKERTIEEIGQDVKEFEKEY